MNKLEALSYAGQTIEAYKGIINEIKQTTGDILEIRDYQDKLTDVRESFRNLKKYLITINKYDKN